MRRLTALAAGAGLGWRPETAWACERNRESLALSEVIAEHLCPDRPLPRELCRLRDAGVPVIPHGVSLGLGGADPPDPGRLANLARAAERLSAPIVSEHVAFVRGGGLETDHLLPVPRTREALDVVVDNVRRAAEALPVPLALENIALLFEWPDQEIEEAAFLTELLERTGALLLLDLSNLYANAWNFGWDPAGFLDRIPLSRLAYVHAAGGVVRGGFYHDTHAHRIGRGALDLLAALRDRIGPVPVLLERDDGFGTRAELEAELDEIREVLEGGAEEEARAGG